MKAICKTLVLLSIAVSFAFIPTGEEEKEVKAEFYYSYIEGYFNGDPDQKGYFFSSIEELDSPPSRSCEGWKAFSEKSLKNFTAKCNTYTVYGPFGVGSSSSTHRRDKMHSFEDHGVVRMSNKGPK